MFILLNHTTQHQYIKTYIWIPLDFNMNRISWYRTSFGEEEIESVRNAISNEHISQGVETEKLEAIVAQSLDVPYAVVTTSGSAALLMSMIAYDIKLGDEVIIPNRTWIATPHAPLMRGAKVTLADVTDNQIIAASDIEKRITGRTKAIIPVHLNGKSADMREINRIAQSYGLRVIEDACQALFSRNEEGYLGTQSDIGCFSLGITKLISTGQGGFLITRDEETYEKLKLIRNHGTVSNINALYTQLGFNFKFTDIQASIGIAQFVRRNEKISHVRKVYDLYRQGIEGLEHIKLFPVNIRKGEIPLYTEALSHKRKALMEYLAARGIQTRPFLPSLESAHYIGDGQKFPNSDVFTNNGLFLPCGPSQSLENVQTVIDALKSFK